MNVREKLVELFYEADKACNNKPCTTCKYQNKKFFCKIHFYIDHFIANGVTVQEWISVKDRLPEKDGHYLCNYHFGEYPKMTFTQVLDYYATDIVPHFQHTLGDGSMKVTHWMEIPKLPQPPKGD